MITITTAQISTEACSTTDALLRNRTVAGVPFLKHLQDRLLKPTTKALLDVYVGVNLSESAFDVRIVGKGGYALRGLAQVVTGMDPNFTAAGTDYWAAVAGNTGQTPAAGTVRTYYIRAERVRWNYAPGGRNRITGEHRALVADLRRAYVRAAPGRLDAMAYAPAARVLTAAGSGAGRHAAGLEAFFPWRRPRVSGRGLGRVTLTAVPGGGTLVRARATRADWSVRVGPQ